jgi:hypothetical protein
MHIKNINISVQGKSIGNIQNYDVLEGVYWMNARHFDTGTIRHQNTLVPRQIGTLTLRYQDKSAPQLDKSALVFFSLISLPLIFIVCILPVFFFS